MLKARLCTCRVGVWWVKISTMAPAPNLALFARSITAPPEKAASWAP